MEGEGGGRGGVLLVQGETRHREEKMLKFCCYQNCFDVVSIEVLTEYKGFGSLLCMNDTVLLCYWEGDFVKMQTQSRKQEV